MARAAPIGGHRRTASPAPTPRPMSSSRSSATTSRTPGRPVWTPFTKQLGDWITHTLAQTLQRQDGAAAGAVLTDRARRPGQSRPARRQGEQPAAGALHARDGGRRQAHNVLVRRSVRGEPQLYASSQAPLTMQGVHLNAEGNRRIAEAIDRALFGAPPEARRAAPHATAAGRRRQEPALVPPLSGDGRLFDLRRPRVSDLRSRHAHQRQRRTAAKAAKEDVLPSNYDVLQRELPILDVMTATGIAGSGPSRAGRRQVRSEDRRRRHAAVRGRADQLAEGAQGRSS